MRNLGAIGFVVLLATGLVAVTTWRRVGRMPRPVRFLEAHELPVVEASVAVASAYLWRERWWRLTGAWAGFLVMMAIQGFRPSGISIGVGHLIAILVGSTIGVAIAARPPRPPDRAVRSASMTVRSVRDYTSTRARRTASVTAAIVTVVGVVAALVAIRRGEMGTASGAILSAGGAAIATVVVGRLQRQVVEAQRPVADAVLVAVDDARRASVVQSLHHALLGGLCCAAILVVGAVGSLGQRVVVRYEGRTVTSFEAFGRSWTASPTPEGGLVLWVDDASGDDHVTIRPPGGRPADATRWEITGATGGGVVTAGVPATSPIWTFAVLVLVVTALVEWSRVRRAPYQPVVVQAGTRRSAAAVPAEPVVDDRR